MRVVPYHVGSGNSQSQRKAETKHSKHQDVAGLAQLL